MMMQEKCKKKPIEQNTNLKYFALDLNEWRRNVGHIRTWPYENGTLKSIEFKAITTNCCTDTILA